MKQQKSPFLKALRERRNFDIYSVNSWVKASDVKSLNSQTIDREQVHELAEHSSHKYNECDYILTPCRFAPSGWKYVRKTQNPQTFLNHPNKRNSVGYYSQVPATGGVSDHLISINNNQTAADDTTEGNPLRSVLTTYKDTFSQDPIKEEVAVMDTATG